jgi:hypothetical protein
MIDCAFLKTELLFNDFVATELIHLRQNSFVGSIKPQYKMCSQCFSFTSKSLVSVIQQSSLSIRFQRADSRNQHHTLKMGTGLFPETSGNLHILTRLS